jgi:hypothetical protein
MDQIILETLKTILPWVLSGIIFLGMVSIYFSTHGNSGFRGVVIYLLHVAVIAIGWFLGKWLGIFLISFPILFFYYYMLFHVARVVVPVSDPDSLSNWQQQFLLLLWYQWGVQYPHWIIPDAHGSTVENRIRGNQLTSFAPGLVWAESHQVVGLTTGLSFSRVAGPGPFFTQPYERPFAVVDLWTQLRTSRIHGISGDGIPYIAVLFMSFAVDQEKWDSDLYQQLCSANPLFKDAKEPDITKGRYSFSQARMRALLTSIEVTSSANNGSQDKTIEWDEGVVFQIEQAAREILSRQRVGDLWRPRDNWDATAVGGEIGAAIKDACFLPLKQRGIHLYICRIVDLHMMRRVI